MPRGEGDGEVRETGFSVRDNWWWWRDVSSSSNSSVWRHRYQPTSLANVTLQWPRSLWRQGNPVNDVITSACSLSSDCKGPFIAKQLNSTRRRVELGRRSAYSDADATQLNSTRLTCFALIGCTLQLGQLHCRSSIVGDSCVALGEGVYSDATQLNSTRRRVELRRRSVYSDPPTKLNSTSSWVELCRYKRALTVSTSRLSSYCASVSFISY